MASTVVAASAHAEALKGPAFRLVAENCAPGVAPDIMEKLVATESGFHPYAIGVNGKDRASFRPMTSDEAAKLARDLIAQGKSIDMGLGQINSANLGWLDLTPETVFDPCRNLAAAEKVLRDGYERARAAGASREDALRQALSSYNTGSLTRGFANGYVDRVLGAKATPAIASAAQPVVLADQKLDRTRDVFGGAGTAKALIFK